MLKQGFANIFFPLCQDHNQKFNCKNFILDISKRIKIIVMTLKKDRSPKEDFEKALIVLERVKNIMMKEYRERRASVERILREKMQK